MSRADDFKIMYHLAVIGAGAAGMITALEFAAKNPEKKILLIEYGEVGQGWSNLLDDSIKNLNPTNHHNPYECTNKGLGGSTATWGGRCVNYDDIDFIERPLIAGACTWDNRLQAEINNYLPTAAKYFECGQPVFNLHQVDGLEYTPIAEGFTEGDVTDSALERWSMPTRFGTRYKHELQKLPNIKLITGFEATKILTENGKVSSIVVNDIKTGENHHVNATTFVIAAGGQETTRLLLRNPSVFDSVGGAPKSLGKFYQGHLSGKIASVKFYGNPKKTDYGFLRDKDGIFLRRRFQFSTRFLKENNLLNTAIWLDNPLYFDPAHRSGAMSFMYLAMITPILGKKLAPPAIAHSVTNGKVNNIPGHIFNILKGLPGSVFTPASIFFKRYLLKRKLPGVFLYSPQNTYALHFHAEQIPNELSTMKLATDGKTFEIDYQFTDDDVNSVIKLHEKLDSWLQQCGCGRLEYWFTPAELPAAIRAMSRDGLHQCGTTRISSTKEDGVVNNDLKLWGMDNLYICSSSVFPTSGQANPTFLLGAFASRLAAHLHSKK